MRDDTPANTGNSLSGKNIATKTTNLLFAKGGWQVCPEKHLLGLGLKLHELSPDKHLRRGDLILAYMPKRLFQEKEIQRRKTANEPMDSVERKVTKGDPKRGLQTKKQLRGNWRG